MKIAVAEIPKEGLDLPIRGEKLSLGDGEAVWCSPATLDGAVRLTKGAHGVLAEGTISAGLELCCSRCLEPFAFAGADRFRVWFVRPAPGASPEERELTADDLDVEFLTEDGIDLSGLLRESVLLLVPIQPLCREECRGLCPGCGANLNEGTCACPPAGVDPRLRPLQKLLTAR